MLFAQDHVHAPSAIALEITTQCVEYTATNTEIRAKLNVLARRSIVVDSAPAKNVFAPLNMIQSVVQMERHTPMHALRAALASKSRVLGNVLALSPIVMQPMRCNIFIRWPF